jgi:hypothetical protein
LPYYLPDEESVFWHYGKWYWYVPPMIEGGRPLIAVAAQETQHTPLYAYPARIMALPITLLGDIVYTVPVSILGLLGVIPMFDR